MADITCPTDCTDQPPSTSANLCAPNTDVGQVERIYIAKEGDGFDGSATFWTNADDWNAKLALTGDDKIRPLFVIGEKPEPEKTAINISAGRVVYGKTKHSISIEVDDVSDTNYEMMRQFECGGTWRVWFKSGNYLYGGNSGILASIDLREIIPRENTDIKKLMGVIEWEAKHSPERTAAPEGMNF